MLHQDFNNVEWAKTASSVLIIHGTKDTAIHFARGKALFDALPQTDKHFLELPDATHEDTLSSNKTLLAIIHFLDSTPNKGEQ